MWNEEDSVSEYEMLSEDVEMAEDIAMSIESQPHDVYDFSEIDDEILEEIQEESAFDLEEDEVASVYNVRTRLEQARLYEMLINHNIFDEVDASEQAIKNVQNELKAYIVSRLELLMGIRAPKAETREEIFIEQPFNDIEIDFIKQLAYKGTKGASAQGEYIQPEIQRVQAQVEPQAPQGLKTLSAPKKVTKPAPVVKEAPLRQTRKAPAKKAPAKRPPAKRPPAKKAPARKAPARKATPKAKGSKTTPSNRTVTPMEMRKNGRNMTQGEIEQIAKEEIAREKSAKAGRKGKAWAKMTATEKAAEVMRTNERNSRTKPEGALPMPSSDEIASMHQTREMMRSGKNNTGGLNLMIANAIAANK